MPVHHHIADLTDETKRQVHLQVDNMPHVDYTHWGQGGRTVSQLSPRSLVLTYERAGIDNLEAPWTTRARVSGHHVKRDGTTGYKMAVSTFISSPGGDPAAEFWPDWVLLEAERYHPGRVDTPDGDPEGSYV